MELFTELLDGLALVGEQQEPEPFGLLGLLYEQFAHAWHGHVHLSSVLAGVRCHSSRAASNWVRSQYPFAASSSTNEPALTFTTLETVPQKNLFAHLR